jgi:hypothetical protein
MSWEDVMRRVLPPIGGIQPHITGPAGAFGAGEPEGRRSPSSIPHGGVDFNYVGGQPNRLNKSNPAVRSPVDGVVVNAGQGSVGRIAIRDKDGFIHEVLHTAAQHVEIGDPVAAGQIIGTMGNTGVNHRNPEKGDYHVHYQMKDRTGRSVNPTEFWNQQGPIDPSPHSPSFLDQSKRAAEILSGLDEKSPRNGGFPPDRPGDPFFKPFNQATPNPGAVASSSAPNSLPFADRFPKFGSVPLPNVPAVSDGPANFSDRFGNWGSSPADGFGTAGVSAPQPMPGPSKRSDIPGDVTPDTAQTTPANWAFPSGDSGVGGVLKYFNAAAPGTVANLPADPNTLSFAVPGITDGDKVPQQRLSSRVINLSAPASDVAPLAPAPVSAGNQGPLSLDDAYLEYVRRLNAGRSQEPAFAADASAPPLVPSGNSNASGDISGRVATAPGVDPRLPNLAASPPLLGIFSGKPMPDWPVRPPVFVADDRAKPDDELFQRWMRWLDV